MDTITSTRRPTAVAIKRSAGRNTLTDTAGVVHDLSRYFTVTRDRQGIRADRAGEFHRGFVVPPGRN